MKTSLFDLMKRRSPKAGLEAHLVAVATAWAAGHSDMPIDSLADFLTYLQREKQWYLADHPRIRSTSVNITMNENVIYIMPGGGYVGPQTADIRLIDQPQTEPAV